MAAVYLYIIAVMGMSNYHGEDPGHLSLYISGYVDTEISLDLPWTVNAQSIALTEGNDRRWTATYRFTGDQEREAVETGIRLTSSQPVSIQVSRGKIYYTSLASYTAFSLKDYSKEFYLSSRPNSPSVGMPTDKQLYTIATGTEPATVFISRRSVDGSFDKVVSYNLTAHSLKEFTVSDVSDSLTGMHVESDSPIAVFSGHQCGNVPTQQLFCEPLFQQILPLAELGTEYIAGPIAERGDSGYTMRIIFTQPDTSLNLLNAGYSLVDVGASSKCPSSPCGPLQPGEYLEFKVNDASTSSAIECSKPCYVYQFNHGGSDTLTVRTDPFMMSLQPLIQKESLLQLSTVSTFLSGYEMTFLSFITVVTQTGARIKLDDAEITNSQQFGNWDVYSKEIQQGFHTVSTVDGQSATMAVQVYGHGPQDFNGHTAYGFPVAFPGVAYANKAGIRQDLPYSCRVTQESSSIIVSTFDEKSLDIPFRNQKTVLSIWEANRNDSCKYSLVAKIGKNINGLPEIKSISMNIGVHRKNNCKFLARLRIEPDKIQWRNKELEISSGFGSLSKDGCTHISLTERDQTLEIRSKTCPYALDVHRMGTFIHHVKLYLGDKYVGDADGLCGNADGDKDNDFSTCFSGNELAQNEEEIMLSCKASERVSDSCVKPASTACKRNCAPFSCASVCDYGWQNTFKKSCAVGCICDADPSYI